MKGIETITRPGPDQGSADFLDVVSCEPLEKLPEGKEKCGNEFSPFRLIS